MTYRVCQIHHADPRGIRVGGTETYLRDYIYYHPQDMELLIVGPDEIGDVPLLEISELEFRGRKYKFLPLYRQENTLNVWADKLTSTDTFVLARNLVKNRKLLSRVLKGGRYSVELRRVEHAAIVRWMGARFVQMQHIFYIKGEPRSGVLGRMGLVAYIAEGISAALCHKFYCVNPFMTEVFKKRLPLFARKFDTLTTWANPAIYKPTPYELDGSKIRMFFAGRADDFKRMDIMMEVIASVAGLTGNGVEFHYVGDGDLEKYSQFAAIRHLTVRHGRKTALELAEIQKSIHIGILTSAFEGMPRVVMETLTAGRPVVALHLPQLEAVITDGKNGYLVPRSAEQVSVLANRIVDTYKAMQAGAITPEGVAAAVRRFTPQVLLNKIFNDHRALHGLPPVSEPL